MTELVLSKGDKVVATLRKPEVLSDLTAKYGSSQLLVLKLDVTKPQEIPAAFAKAKQAFGKIDVVFNNAGWSIFGETESVSEEQGRAMFDTNFWGAANVMKEAVRFFREENAPGVGGHLINNSSMVGISALPTTSYYAASKFGEYNFHRTSRSNVLTIIDLQPSKDSPIPCTKNWTPSGRSR